MEAYIADWLNLFGRWVHLITGIAWIGASFYFVWLDDHLLSPRDVKDTERGIAGEVWSVHGGGFYHAQKFKLTPPFLPEPLHWFKWEAYWTWMSGVFLLALIYWYGAEIYLIDPNVMALGKPMAVALGVATLAGGWLVYDALCKSALGKDDKKLAGVIFIFVSVVAYVLCQIFSGLGAYIHYGAMQGELTVESTAERAGAGIDQCSQEEFERFQRYNGEYTRKYGFPFVVAVKGSNRHAILAAFEERLEHDADTEFRRALAEIDKIARFRLEALADAS